MSSEQLIPTGGKPPPDASEENGRTAQLLVHYAAMMKENGPETYRKLDAFVKGLGPAVHILWDVVEKLASLYYWFYQECYTIYRMLPTNVIQAIFGLALCFFGGTFVVSIAAIEAFRCLGAEQVWNSVCIVWRNGERALAKVKEDKDGNGIPDIEEQVQGSELVRQKVIVGMKEVQEPEVLQQALLFLYTSWISVLATLKVQFARTTALALGIADCVKLPLTKILGMPLTLALGKDLCHWSDTIIDTSLKIIALWFAWWIQSVVSAFYTGIRGSRMFAEAFVDIMDENNLLDYLPACLKPSKKEGSDKPDLDTTMFDEILMVPIFVIGFGYQLQHGFTFAELPLMIKVVLFPLELIEWILEWKVTWG